MPLIASAGDRLQVLSVSSAHGCDGPQPLHFGYLIHRIASAIECQLPGHLSGCANLRFGSLCDSQIKIFGLVFTRIYRGGELK
ncbi:hypothetical protein C5F53_06725 [Rhodoferax sp. TS-BS-61-7]|nr:hypothetical protein C5F53_06725 [Rhodoferax sp. TS-BS-61-7]